ncbi:nuclear transport factor 2 family protein [Pseudonocardia sp. ICBG1293]|uniref:nuclear transport factor 2 family protein n=1 Tax=Pseudonocardia sp. ICBG1293 TaxID=2844382 RepID=UPI001CCCADB6|nr:nuclear transport factor 2 family protein [Pseudonocardia sp. ICBG1293]
MDDEVAAAYERWSEAIGDRGRERLEFIHGDDFVYVGADGYTMDRSQHIAMELVADLEHVVAVDVVAVDLGRVVVASGRHNIKGHIPLEHSGEYSRHFLSTNLDAVFTTVWRRERDGLRAWCMHVDLGDDLGPAVVLAPEDVRPARVEDAAAQAALPRLRATPLPPAAIVTSADGRREFDVPPPSSPQITDLRFSSDGPYHLVWGQRVRESGRLVAFSQLWHGPSEEWSLVYDHESGVEFVPEGGGRRAAGR